MARTTLWAPLAVLAVLAHLAVADVEFVSPKAGGKLTGGGAIEVEWKDSGDKPVLADLTTYELFLCAGGNGEVAGDMIQIPITQQATTFAVTGNKATGTVGVNFGASKPENAYFLKMVSTAAKGGTVTNYSKRFTLTGMTGTFPQAVIDGLDKVKGTDGPDRVDATANAPGDPAANEYEVEYTMQTGLTRFAPMQPIPPTKLMKNKKPTPLHPTSAFTIATTWLPNPKQLTTITQSGTFSVKSRENTAAPVAGPTPTDDMEKFLMRWKD